MATFLISSEVFEKLLLFAKFKETWEHCVKCDIRKDGMQRVEPFDKDKYRSCCGSNHPTRESMEKRML